MAIGRIGGEILVNTTTVNRQYLPTVTGIANGRFIISWTDQSTTGEDTSQDSIRARIFNADGSQYIPEFLVNTTIAGAQEKSSLATLLDGRIVMSWTDRGVFGPLAPSVKDDIRSRVLQFDGSPSVPEFVVNANLVGYRTDSRVTGLTDGRLVVSWSGGDGEIYARIFSAFGVPVSNDVVINTTTSQSQFSSSIASLPGGRFIVAWDDTSASGGDTSSSAVRARIFNSDGSQSVPEFIVNATTTSSQFASTIAVFPDGRFVVSWSDISLLGGDSNGYSIRARIFNGDGTESVPEFLVNSTTVGNQLYSTVAVLADGRFVVIWIDTSATGGDTSSNAIRGRVFNSDGSPSLPEFLVNTTTLGNQFGSAVAALSNGSFVVTWADGSQTGGDVSAEAVRAQVFDPTVFGGTPAGDTVNGGDFSDTYSGLAGNDNLSGRGGNDRLNGGDDNDTLIGDGPVSLTSAAQQIKRLYIATLDRGPDSLGWQGWATAREGGQALTDIAGGFVGSAEFQAKYGNLNNTQFVQQLYRNVLDREADQGGLTAFTDALNSGAQSRTQVVVNFSESGEFTRGTSPDLHAGQIYRLYGATLGRAPDAGGFEGWTDALGGGRGLGDIAGGFVGSSEFQARYGALDNTGFVTLLYQNVLGRAPDANGLAGWRSQLDSGSATRTQVVTGFSESGEYINGTRAATDAFMRNVMAAWSDTLVGGQGNDQLTGGRGSDRYVFNASEASNDTIYGFESFDTLELNGFSFGSIGQALGAASQQGANVVLGYNGGSITFADTQLSVLQSMTAQGWVFG